MRPSHPLRSLTIFLLVAASSSAAQRTPAAQKQPTTLAPIILDSTLRAAYKWRIIGPDRGGRSIAVTGVKGRPKEAYFGAVGGGLWKTTDGGDNWGPVTDGQLGSASVGAVAVSEANPDVVSTSRTTAARRGRTSHRRTCRTLDA